MASQASHTQMPHPIASRAPSWKIRPRREPPHRITPAMAARYKVDSGTMDQSFSEA